MMELRVCHLYPDVLNLYGDRGNVLCIKKRLEWRGIGCTVTELPIGERRPLGGFDLFFVGGGQDFEQGLLLEDLRGGKGADIRAAAEDGAAFLCVCGGYQLMGHYYDTAAGVRCAGVDVLDLATEGAEERMIGNFAFETEFGSVVGFENHSGRTRLGPNAKPLGREGHDRHRHLQPRSGPAQEPGFLRRHPPRRAAPPLRRRGARAAARPLGARGARHRARPAAGLEKIFFS